MVGLGWFVHGASVPNCATSLQCIHAVLTVAGHLGILDWRCYLSFFGSAVARFGWFAVFTSTSGCLSLSLSQHNTST